MEYFDLNNDNRSERAFQADILVPILKDKSKLAQFFTEVNLTTPLIKGELDQLRVFHFVWVLRDKFFADREKAKESSQWQELVNKWCEVLSLPIWANDLKWWRHPDGSYGGLPDFIVHPCNRKIGWVRDAILSRVPEATQDEVATLIEARKLMNTECDCLIQTNNRLVVIECKYYTSFLKEQRMRQKLLFSALQKLYPLQYHLEYLEISNEDRHGSKGWISWEKLRSI